MATVPWQATSSSGLSNIRRMAEDGGLYLTSQPIRTVDGKTYGYELLVRCEDGSAEEIVAALSGEGLLYNLTVAVALKAQELAAEAGLPFHFNAEPQHLPRLAAWFNQKRPSSQIGVEVYERGGLDTEVVEAMRQLMELGIGVFLDDTDRRRNSDLKADLPLTGLKLGHTAVHAALSEPNNGHRALMRGIAELCSERGLVFIPEGVTEAAAVTLKKDLGISLYQAYEFQGHWPI